MSWRSNMTRAEQKVLDNDRRSTPVPHLSRRTFLRESLLFGAGVAGLGVTSSHVEAQGVGGHGQGSLFASRNKTPTTIRQKVGQLFVVSFAGLVPQADFVALLESRAFGGAILYARNAQSAGQVRSLIAGLQQVAPFPLLVCADQEGGKVVRIRQGAPVFPAEAVYGRIGSIPRVSHDAARTARSLRSLGLTLNLAPVVDVLSNRTSPIGDRSYGSDPYVVACLSATAIRGYQSNGLAATAKHFIGLGHTSVDSHQALPTVGLTLEQLRHNDLIPFQAAIAANVSTILVAHVALPAVDPIHRPASLSPVIINGVLRRQLGFKGLVMTDSLVMGALPPGHEAEAAERAFTAGADILLMGQDQDIPFAMIEEAVDRVVAAVLSRRVPESRLDEAVGRILALKNRYGASPG